MSIIEYSSPGFIPRTLVAGFDLDWTLIKTTSGRIHPKTPSDWMLHNQNVVHTLKQLHASGYAICIFTNQEGVTKGRITQAELIEKFEAIQHVFNIPCLFMAAIRNDEYRKPRTAMWRKIQTEWFAQSEINIDVAKSLYVGDAAGRPRTLNRKADFNDTDYKFALNIGVGRFEVPETFFKLTEAVPHRSLWSVHIPSAFSPSSFVQTRVSETIIGISTESPVLWLCMGPPAAGKTTFCKQQAKTIQWINQDTLKTQKHCLANARTCLEQSQSCIVDGTHRTVKARATYLQLAKEQNVPCKCLWFDQTKEVVFHLNTFRLLTGGSYVPDVAIHSYFKRVECPTEDEGFAEIIKIPWVAKFESKEAQTLCGKYLR